MQIKTPPSHRGARRQAPKFKIKSAVLSHARGTLLAGRPSLLVATLLLREQRAPLQRHSATFRNALCARQACPPRPGYWRKHFQIKRQIFGSLLSQVTF